jgi:hypothetical protein
MKLSYVNWESVFINSDINSNFYQFLNIFLGHFYASFPLSRMQKYTQNSWITVGIIISHRKKGALYAEVRNKILKFGNIIRDTVNY